jgi:hypothetical protein
LKYFSRVIENINTHKYSTKTYKVTKMTSYTNSQDNAPAIYIPSLHSKTTDKKVFHIMKELDLGFIENIRMISRENKETGKTWQSAVVSLRWADNDRALVVRQRLLEPKGELKVEYNPPYTYYWMLRKWSEPAPKAAKPQLIMDLPIKKDIEDAEEAAEDDDVVEHQTPPTTPPHSAAV